MGITERFVVGIVKGLLDEDIDDWLDDLPKVVGEKIGSAIKRNRGTDGSITREGIEALEEMLSEDSELARETMAVILAKEVQSSDSLLPNYLEVVNLVTEVTKTTQRTIVLKGFLHSEECLSYWDHDFNSPVGVNGYEIHPSVSVISLRDPKVYLISSTDLESDFKELNLKIRMNDSHRLHHDIYFAGKEVDSLREFKVELAGYDAETLEIPFGAVGLVTMAMSISEALEIQGTPDRLLQDTMRNLHDSTRAS